MILDKRIKLIERLFFVLLVCTGCINSQMMSFGVVTAKIVWFFFITGSILFFFVTSIGDLIRFRFNVFDKLICCWFGYIIVNSFLHSGGFLSITALQQFGLFVTFLYAKRLFTANEKKDNFLMLVLLIFTLIQIGIVVLQWSQILPSYNNNFKITGIFFNPAPFAIFLSSLLMFSLSALFYNANRLIKIIAFISLMVSIPILIIAFSRSAWLGFFVGSMTIITSKLDLRRRLAKYFMTTIIRSTFLVVMSFCIFLVSQSIYNLKIKSAQGRVLTWKISYSIVKDNPLWGLGTGGMEKSFLKYQSEYFQNHPEKIDSEGYLSGQVVYAFNDLFQILIEQGIIGVSIFLALIILYFKYLLKVIKSTVIGEAKGKDLLMGSSMAVLVILVSGLFSYPFTILPLQIIFYCCLGKISTWHDIFSLIPSAHVLSEKRRALIYSFKTLCFVGGLTFFCYASISIKGYLLAKKLGEDGYNNNLRRPLDDVEIIFKNESWFILAKAEFMLQRKDYENAIKYLENAKKVSSDMRIYYTLSKLYVHKRHFLKAEQQYLFLFYCVPSLLKPKYELTCFYFNTKQIIKWKKYADIVINYKPNIESSKTEAMKREIMEQQKSYLKNL